MVPSQLVMIIAVPTEVYGVKPTIGSEVGVTTAKSLESFLQRAVQINTNIAARDVAAAPQTPNRGGGPGQLWGPKLV